MNGRLGNNIRGNLKKYKSMVIKEVRQAIRLERNDVFEFWGEVQSVINNQIVTEEVKIEEVTINQLNERIEQLSLEASENQVKIAAEQVKIQMIQNLIICQ